MKIKLHKKLCVPRVTLGGEDALQAENRVAVAVLRIGNVATRIRDALPTLIQFSAPSQATASVAHALVDAEAAASEARWAVDYLRDEINPHRAAIKAVLEAETTEAFDQAAKAPKAKAGKRGAK